MIFTEDESQLEDHPKLISEGDVDKGKVNFEFEVSYNDSQPMLMMTFICEYCIIIFMLYE